jgi:hypothetical protein
MPENKYRGLAKRKSGENCKESVSKAEHRKQSGTAFVGTYEILTDCSGFLYMPFPTLGLL